MSNLTKKQKIIQEKHDPEKTYSLEEAMDIIQSVKSEKFDESIDISESSETFKPLASEITNEDALDATSLTSRTIFSFSFLDNATAILQLKPFDYLATNCKNYNLNTTCVGN